MRLSLLPACLFLFGAQPAFADKLTVAETYRWLQGDWGRVPESNSDEVPCQSWFRRFSLDAGGHELTIRDIRLDGSIVQEFKYGLTSIPLENDKSRFLEFLGPDVARSKDRLVWRESLSISMTDVDHLYQYWGYAPWGDYAAGVLEIVPHGDGSDLIRCK